MPIAHIKGKKYDANGHLVPVDRSIGGSGDALSYLVILHPKGNQMVGIYAITGTTPPGIELCEMKRASEKERPNRGTNFTYVGSRWFNESENHKKRRASVKISIE